MPHGYALKGGDLLTLDLAAIPGAKIGDISHGIGTTMHQEPHISNVGEPGRGYRLRPGLLLASAIFAPLKIGSRAQ